MRLFNDGTNKRLVAALEAAFGENSRKETNWNPRNLMMKRHGFRLWEIITEKFLYQNGERCRTRTITGIKEGDDNAIMQLRKSN